MISNGLPGPLPPAPKLNSQATSALIPDYVRIRLGGTNSHRLTNSDPSLYAARLLIKMPDVSAPPETPSPRSRIDALLRSLFGETAGGQTAARLADLIAGKRTE